MPFTEHEKVILASVDSLQEKALQMLSTLVGFDSQIGQEKPAQDYMAEYFSDQGLEVDRFEIDLDLIKDRAGYSPALIDYHGRENVIGIHRAVAPFNQGRSLILNGHIDVVPTGPLDRWQSHPFEARIDGDKFFGRGSGDMKAGIVAYCMALEAIKTAGYSPGADVFLQSVIEEECTGNGALACLARGYQADAAIIPEPFAQKMMNAQLGVMWLSLSVTGHPAHVFDTSAGINAIEAAFYIYNQLKVLESQWNLAENRHPSFSQHEHPVNFNLGKINGGDWASTVPTHCDMDVRIGFYPDIPLSEIKSTIEQTISQAQQAHEQADRLQVKIHYKGFQAEGFVADLNEPLFTELAHAHEAITATPIKHMASTATTDARFFHLYGNTPATCYGPVADNYHSFDEWVSISSMLEVTRVLALFISRWCGVTKNN